MSSSSERRCKMVGFRTLLAKCWLIVFNQPRCLLVIGTCTSSAAATSAAAPTNKKRTYSQQEPRLTAAAAALQ
jgi:hypothetical protein